MSADQVHILQFPQSPRRLEVKGDDEVDAFSRELRSLILKYCPGYYTAEGQAELRRWQDTRRGKLAW